MPRVPQASPARAKRDGHARGPRFEGGCTVHFSTVRMLPMRQIASLVDQPRVMRLTAIRHMTQREGDEEGEAGEVDRLEAEGAAADQFDQLVQRVELGDDLDALGRPSIGKKVPATRKSGVTKSAVT